MKRPAVLLALMLFLVSAALIVYRILWLGYPLLPTVPEKVWQLTMDARVKGSQSETTAMISLPYSRAGEVIIEERIHSGALNFNLVRQGPNQMGVWSGPVDENGEVLRYSALIHVRPRRTVQAKPPEPQPYPDFAGDADRAAAKRLAARWAGLSPGERVRAVAATTRNVWGKPDPDGKDLQRFSSFLQQHGRVPALLLLLKAAGLPARMVQGLALSEGVSTAPVTWIQVWTGREWERLHPDTGAIYPKSVSLLPLSIGNSPIFRAIDGEIADLRWLLNEEKISHWRIHFERIRRSNHLLDRWSLFQLPADFQETFRILLLVPIGALLIIMLRNMIGFPTFGIFMPVLMALAFRNTGLAYGLGVFAGVILIGYYVRRWVDRLRLLLVSRLSVILTFVIACITIFALIGNKLGLREFMAVGLLPFVILTMTIERFFVIAEEAGIKEGLWTAAGTAAVSTIAYEIIHVEPLQLTFFVYPELLLSVAGLQILLGRYTGYRLSELFRFRKFKRRP